MGTKPPRQTAWDFLTGEHGLDEDEAAQAMDVAETVVTATLERLDAAVAAGDGPGCQEAAHALKGNMLNLGLADLAALAQAIERMSRAGDATGCARLARNLGRALASFRPA